ncbi:endolytic transglycosylase MltG [Longimicrobium sp.]|uniref:endolytic transglycosylase MltG n=1 Tax=Longimicrobium sp. TaxID=2029185 RepID=UPI002BA322C6|nr:endolytic transglycosylase MltG [Longimicrobium sp.]HSU12988.1 endolytic transglycosylase MltG [Longimicrobium sp.]
MKMRAPFRTFALSHFRTFALVALLATLAACATDGGGNPHGPPLRVTVPAGAALPAVADSLAKRGIVDSGDKFRRYAKAQDAASKLKPGIYEFRSGESWKTIVGKLVRGDVVKARIVVPEGWTARQIAARVAAALGGNEDSIHARLVDTAAARRYGVPGPTLEGYLYPATYVFPLGTPVEKAVAAMVQRYKSAWTPQMRAQLPASGMSEREVVALASIVEREAKDWHERPTIAAVYRNRMRKGMRLQADPTVQYALGQQRARLLYRDIASVSASPYNTYTHAGLPPGPIASPSQGAIQAALNPAPADYLYFVARPNGTHVFTRTLAEHNAAKRAAQAEARGAR